MNSEHPMPKLEAGMIIEFYWTYSGPKKYLCLGGNKTLQLGGYDRSQPLRGTDNGKLLKIYSVSDMQSWEDYIGESGFGMIHLIWEYTPSDTETKIEELEATVKDAVKQIEELKDTL